MKTIFKVGMKVYDQVCFPNKEGVIVGIDEEWAKLNYPCLKVKFQDETQEFSYTNEGCLCDNYYWIPTLSTSPYTLQGFEQKEPAKTYEEALKWCIGNLKDYRECVCTEYVNEKQENALEALRKLIILRDYYNEGWEANWEEQKRKYCILVNKKEIDITDNETISRVLCFKSGEIRDKFLEEQKELLEIAKPLL